MTPDHPITRPRIDVVALPFSETVAFRRFAAAVDPDRAAPEDLYLKAIIQEQGFDGLPHTVSRRRFDAYVRSGEREMFRGVADAAHAEAFRSGPFFVGRGVYGGGANAAAGASGLAFARSYAQGGVVMRLVLKAGARVAEFDELEALAAGDRRAAMDRIREAEVLEMGRAISGAVQHDIASIRRRFGIARAAVQAY